MSYGVRGVGTMVSESPFTTHQFLIHNYYCLLLSVYCRPVNGTDKRATQSTGL